MRLIFVMSSRCIFTETALLTSRGFSKLIEMLGHVGINELLQRFLHTGRKLVVLQEFTKSHEPLRANCVGEIFVSHVEFSVQVTSRFQRFEPGIASGTRSALV